MASAASRPPAQVPGRPVATAESRYSISAMLLSLTSSIQDTAPARLLPLKCAIWTAAGSAVVRPLYLTLTARSGREATALATSVRTTAAK